VERIARLVVILLVVGGVVFAGVALAGNGRGGDFRPGKGCGDKNHVHYRQDECKRHDDGHHGGDSFDHHRLPIVWLFREISRRPVPWCSANQVWRVLAFHPRG
jgi:hypothetical protein